MMSLRYVIAFLFLVLSLAMAQCEQPEKVSACQLKANPTSYNHKLVEVTAFVSHGFEDFSLFNPECLPWMGIWVEYGGTANSGTVYCCGVTASRSRPHPLQVEGVSIPLAKDEQFRRFDELIQSRPGRLIHGTLVGRFFSGNPERTGDGKLWGGGYGHMGCCSLFVIQQVVSVERQDRDDVDYRSSYEQPDIRKAGCGYRDLISFEPFLGVVQGQRKAEDGGPEWVFQDPDRVATHELAILARLDEKSIRLKQTEASQGHKVYEWKTKFKDKSYMVVVSRPYLATFYARNPMKIAWIAIAVFEVSCDAANSVTRIK